MKQNFIFAIFMLAPFTWFSATHADSGPIVLPKNCEPYVMPDVNLGKLSKIFSAIRKKMFRDREAALPELKPLVQDLKEVFSRTRPDTPEEIEEYRQRVQQPDWESSAAASELPLVDEYLRLRPKLIAHVTEELETLLKDPKQITYSRYVVLHHRAGLAMTTLLDTLTMNHIQSMIYFLREEMKLLNIAAAAPDELIMNDWEKDSYPSYRLQMVHLIQAAPVHLYIPDTKSFSIETIVEAFDDFVSLGQNVFRPTDLADSVWRNSSNFENHDKNHAHMWNPKPHSLT